MNIKKVPRVELFNKNVQIRVPYSAFAYKYKLEAIKAQGKRSDLTSGQVDQNLSRDIVAQEGTDSSKNVQRYIRLTNLNNQLLEKVDERKLAFIPAVELSYLSKKERVFWWMC